MCKTKQMLKYYQEALNKIEDYFEYSNKSSEDKMRVMKIIDDLTTDLRKMNETTN
jgi:hypothetical protein